MASSSDAVRNFVYDVHLYSLKQVSPTICYSAAPKGEAMPTAIYSFCSEDPLQGWEIVQQLAEKRLDSWERIHEAFPVKDPNEEKSWDAADEEQVTAFAEACPLLGNKLAAQLAAQAALFVHHAGPQPLERGSSLRLGSLRERINRLYFKEKGPSKIRQFFSEGLRLPASEKGKLVPFSEAVDQPGFLA